MAQISSTPALSSDLTRNPAKKPTKNTKRTIRLLFVDDCKISLNAWKFHLSKRCGFSVTGLAPDRLQTLHQAVPLAPDVVVITIPLLNSNGVSAMHLLHKIIPSAKVIGFGGDGDCNRTREMLRAGAKGFLEKNCSPSDLIQAIERVSRGEVFLSPRIQQMMIDVDGTTARAPAEFPRASLSARECEIVGEIANGLANKEVASRLGMSVRTVEKRRLMIMQKLGLAGVAQLTKYAIRHGITALE
ncbi:MAG: response regulator transcription factor [Verrucomicrobia bacterium]|nr:response regulator transcription factor [Verrucomicrobiota bacterium]